MSTVEIYKRQAKTALEKRAKLIDELRSLEKSPNFTEAEKRERVERIDAELHALEAEAREAVENAERLVEVRSQAERAGGLLIPGNGPRELSEWRSLMPSKNEYRALISEGVPQDGGYTVPIEVAGKYVDALIVKSTFLRGLPSENVIPFTSETLSIPQLISSDGAEYVAEGELIPEGDMVWGQVKFEAKKIGRIQWASSEILEDSAVDQRNAIAQNLLRDASLKFDADAFVGSGTNPIKGIVSQGVTTTLGTDQVAVTYDDLADAVARIEAMNGTPSVVWASIDMAAALRKEKATGSGTYQAGSPTGSPAATAWGLPILPSAFLPAQTVVVADASRIMVGVRRNPTLRISEDARFDSDQVGFRLTLRVAGVSVAEPSSVQIIKAAAS